MKQNKDFSTYIARSQVFAGICMICGCRLLRMDKDKDNEYRNVFLFANTHKLQRIKADYEHIKSLVNPVVDRYR